VNQSYRPREMMGRILTAFGFAVAFAMVTLFIYPRYGLAFSLFVMFVLTIMLVRAFSRGYLYRCLNCGNQFKAPMLVHFLTFSGMGRNPDGTWNTWKSLTCPSCGKRTRAVAVKARPGEATATTPYESRAGVRPTATRDKPRAQQRRGGRKR
jgi:DNA-directed RNA polymerase subunit RPC12/RpoP